MKILLLNQTYYPDQAATAQQLTDLASHLVERGHQVTVVASQLAYGNPEKRHSPEEVYRGVRILRISSTGFGKRSFFHRVIDGLSFEIALVAKLLALPSQDLVIGFTSPPLIGLAAVIFTWIKGGRSAQWLMDVNPDAAIAVGYLKRRSLAAIVLNGVFEFCLRQSRHIIVLDRWMREKIIAHGADPSRVAIIPPWPPHEKDQGATGKAFRAEHGLGNRFVVLYSGNHSIVHPLDTLLAAALNMRDREDVVFLFIGGGLRVEDVTAFRKKHSLKNIIQLEHQPRERLADTLASADLHVVVMGEAVAGLVHTSKIYGVLGTGKPYLFIGPKRSHVGDLLNECPYGFHVEHGDAAGIEKRIDRAKLLTPEELEVYRRENKQFLSTHYTPSKTFEKFVNEVLLVTFTNEVAIPGRNFNH